MMPTNMPPQAAGVPQKADPAAIRQKVLQVLQQAEQICQQNGVDFQSILAEFMQGGRKSPPPPPARPV